MPTVCQALKTWDSRQCTKQAKMPNFMEPKFHTGACKAEQPRGQQLYCKSARHRMAAIDTLWAHVRKHRFLFIAETCLPHIPNDTTLGLLLFLFWLFWFSITLEHLSRHTYQCIFLYFEADHSKLPFKCETTQPFPGDVANQKTGNLTVFSAHFSQIYTTIPVLIQNLFKSVIETILIQPFLPHKRCKWFRSHFYSMILNITFTISYTLYFWS